LIPGGPAVAFRQAVGGVVSVFRCELGLMPVALLVGGLVVAELAALLTVSPFITGAGDSVVVGVCAVAHGWVSSGGMWSGQGYMSPQRALASQTPPFHTAASGRRCPAQAGTEPDPTALSHPITAAGNRISAPGYPRPGVGPAQGYQCAGHAKTLTVRADSEISVAAPLSARRRRRRAERGHIAAVAPDQFASRSLREDLSADAE
jgi:hypothetical protein